VVAQDLDEEASDLGRGPVGLAAVDQAVALVRFLRTLKIWSYFRVRDRFSFWPYEAGRGKAQ
jgi:hypothetical protein